MPLWKDRLEIAISEFEDRDELNSEYTFGNPATGSEISALEACIGRQLPADLRELLEEFNGVSYRDTTWGEEWRPLYLSTAQIANELQTYFAESGNPLPEDYELERVMFFAHQNGFGVLYCVCAEDFGEFSAGQILAMESGVGELYVEQDSLESFVSSPEYCSL